MELVGDHIPPTGEVIEVHLAESKQLFNAIDPAPFREKDLDPNRSVYRRLGAGAPR